MRVLIFSVLFCMLVGSANVFAQHSDHPCDSEIYCYGELLHQAQMSNWEKDSKTFVDMALRFPPDVVLANFEKLVNRTDKDIHDFINANFVNGTEFDPFEPKDWDENPAFLQHIQNEDLRQFGKDLHDIWHVLGRKIKDDVKDHPDLYSMHYVTNGVIVPGGRFKEFYYWDSYWIQKGLIVSGMTETVKGMIENFMEIVDDLGFIPNGGRIYYQRTQPPLFLPMIKNYYDATEDLEFVKLHIEVMIKEFMYFMENRTQDVTLNDGRTFKMARYNVELNEPRPESYREDYQLAQWTRASLEGMNATTEFIDKVEKELYWNLKSGAESGWDFSSRWFVPLPNSHVIGDLMNIRTSDIIPADLNGFLYWNAIILRDFCTLIANVTVCDPTVYDGIANEFKDAINEVLWDEESGSWYDYDFRRKELRKTFYPTNLVPLWVHAHKDDTVVPKVVNYLENSGALKFPGGVPTSLFQTGQQWDFPNGWAPLQHIVVEALENSNNAEAKTIAFDLAQRWVQSNHLSYQREKAMFEKYDVSIVGGQGGGGEYEVVVGFGWSNGVVLDFLKMYGDRLQSLPGTPSGGTRTAQFTTFTKLPIFLILSAYFLKL